MTLESKGRVLRDDAGLGFFELHTSGTASVVLIHGGFSQGREWREAGYRLAQYHVLIPDLPGHGRSRNIEFTLVKAADMVADLVRQRGRNGKARVVGLSLGAHVALRIITKHADVVDGDAILMGCNVWPELNPFIFSGLGCFGTRISDLFANNGQTRVDDDGTQHPPQRWRYWKTAAQVICGGEAWPEPWSCRTLILQALNRGGTPVTDRLDTARKLRSIGVKGNSETFAVAHKDLVHPWPVEKPELAAETILAWFERRPLGSGFFEL